MLITGNRERTMHSIGQLHAMRNKKIKPYDNLEEIYADTFDAIAKEMGLAKTKDLFSIIEYGDAIDLGYIDATVSDMKRRIVQKAVIGKYKPIAPAKTESETKQEVTNTIMDALSHFQKPKNEGEHNG